MFPVRLNNERSIVIGGTRSRRHRASRGESDGHHSAGRLHPERRRRVPVHQLLPPGRLHQGPVRGLPGRAVARCQGRDGADPHQLAHERRGASADLSGHRDRDRLHPRRHGRALGHEDEPAADGRRRRAPRLYPRAQQAARVDPRGPRRCAEEHRRQHAGGGARRARPGRHSGSDRRREGRWLREQVEVRDAAAERQHRRLGALHGADHGRGLVSARDCCRSASAARQRRRC